MRNLCVVILAVMVMAVTSYSQYLNDPNEPFKCPICIGIGKNAEEDCDDTAEYRACHAKDAVCVTTLTGDLMMRECFGKSYYNDYMKPKCDAIEGCQQAICEESGCTAMFPDDNDDNDWEGEYDPMECPICIGMGDNAEEECDKTTKYYTCNDKEAVCVSIKSGGLLMRECFNQNYYFDYVQEKCEKTEGCESKMCFDSGCKAKLPSSAEKRFAARKRLSWN